MKKLTCIVCPRGCTIIVKALEYRKDEYEITGNLCPKGKEYALSEMTNPKRSITTTVKTVYRSFPRLPVRTDAEVDLKNIFPVMNALNSIEVNHPVSSGEIIASNILGTGINIVATSDMYEVLGENARL